MLRKMRHSAFERYFHALQHKVDEVTAARPGKWSYFDVKVPVHIYDIRRYDSHL